MILKLFLLFPFLLGVAWKPIPGVGSAWYKILRGKIGSYPVTMHLHKYGHGYSGYYFYDSRQDPLYFSGEDTTSPGRVSLVVWLPDRENEERFQFRIDEEKITGEWSTSGKKEALSFQAMEVKPSSQETFTYVYTTGLKSLRPAMANSPVASFEAGSVWPTGTGARTSFLKKIIREEFGEKNTGRIVSPGQEIDEILAGQQKEFFESYVDENKELKESEIIEFGFTLNMDETSRLMIVYSSPSLLTLSHYSYAYTGGAHGNYGTSFTSLDMVNMKRLKLKDVLNATGQQRLPALLEKYFRLNQKLKPSDPLTEGGLFENKMLPNDNFYITAGGIGFSYVPYEIAAFAVGEINIFIPFKELDVYLLPAFKKLVIE